MTDILARYPKIEQIALHVPNIDWHKIQMEKLLNVPLDSWINDNVYAEGHVFGVEGGNSAELAFNYKFGYEFELLKYTEGNNWHLAKKKDLSRPFLSHKGAHVTNVEEEKEFFKQSGIAIAQEVKTVQHSNKYLQQVGRKYHYVIFDTEMLLGFDLKLIQRIENEKAA